MIQRNKSAGFTLLEMVLALVLVAVVSVKAYRAMASASDTLRSETIDVVLEDRARGVLRQIAFAVMGSSRDSLAPGAVKPLSANSLAYSVNLGIQDGVVVWSDPEMIAMDESDLTVFWTQEPTAVEARKVVWTSLVAPFLEGELPNGMDDNGNGLIDESGLSFVVDGDSVTIRMTLNDTGPDGEVLIKTVQTTVTCRNVPNTDS